MIVDIAHGLVGRTDLPIPKWLFAWAAAVVLLVSFAALATLWPKPRLENPDESPWVRLPRILDPIFGAIGIALFVLVVYAGFAGSQSVEDNLAPTFIFVAFWVGVPVLSVLFGDVFKAFNPWRAIARAVAFVAGRFSSGEPPEALAYPDRVGRWPAALSIFAFTWIELVYVNRDDPSTLAILSLAYAAVQLIGMAFYGIDRWTERADGFSVLFNFFGRLSPFYARPFLSGTTSIVAVPGTVALLCVAIGTTSFDGFSAGSVWADIGPDLQSVFRDLGLGVDASGQAASTVGMVLACLLIAGVYRLGVRGMQTVGEGHTAGELARLFAHSLIPIAFGYMLAHYFSLLVYRGQVLDQLFADPLGGERPTVDYGVISATGIWYVQVTALVLGHVAGLVLAHDRALAVYRGVRAATRSQYWMLAVMVGFTSFGLWLLSSLTA